MLHLIVKQRGPLLLYTSSPVLAQFLTKEIIQNCGYYYSENEIKDKTITTCFEYGSAKAIQPKNDTIIVSTLEESIWQELNPTLKTINLDNLPSWMKINLIAYLVFSAKNLRKSFSSNFWISLLKIISNNFFELYFIYKIITKTFGEQSKNDEKVSLNKTFIRELLGYIEDNFIVEDDIGVYPSEKEISKFLYFLINPFFKENPYKFLVDMDLYKRIYHKYKILSELSAKNLDKLVISLNDNFIFKLLEILNKLGDFSYITCLDDLPAWDSNIIEQLDLENFYSIYPFSLIFCLLDKKIVILEYEKKYFLFEVKNIKASNIDFKSFFKRYGWDLNSINFINYTSNEVYSSFLKLVISSLKVNLSLAYNIISIPLLAHDYEYYNNKGFILLLFENLEQARENFEKYLKIDPQDLLVNYNLAVSYWLEGKYEKALKIISDKIDSVISSRLFSVVLPIYPFKKKELLFEIESLSLYRISLANLLFLTNRKEEAKKIISKIDSEKIKPFKDLFSYFVESYEYIFR